MEHETELELAQPEVFTTAPEIEVTPAVEESTGENLPDSVIVESLIDL